MKRNKRFICFWVSFEIERRADCDQSWSLSGGEKKDGGGDGRRWRESTTNYGTTFALIQSRFFLLCSTWLALLQRKWRRIYWLDRLMISFFVFCISLWIVVFFWLVSNTLSSTSSHIENANIKKKNTKGKRNACHVAKVQLSAIFIFSF